MKKDKCILGDRCEGCNRCGLTFGDGVLHKWGDAAPTPLDEMLSTVRCLSVRQPYAELIARGDKPIELRTKAFKYRGPLVIVSCARRAAAHPDVDGPRSRAVALVEMVDARPATKADSKRACCEVSPGEFAWVFRLVRRLDIDVHVKGQLSIYPPPPELRAALEKALVDDDSDRSDSCDECGDAFTESGPCSESLSCPGTCVDCYLNGDDDEEEEERELDAEDLMQMKEDERADREYAMHKDDEP